MFSSFNPVCASIVCALLLQPQAANAQGVADTPKEPIPCVRFRDGKLIEGQTLYSWDGFRSGVYIYTPRDPGQIVEINVNDTGEPATTQLVVRIPFDKLRAVNTLSKPVVQNWPVVEAELVDGKKVTGRLRGVGWHGRVKPSNGLEEEVSIDQQDLAVATMTPSTPGEFMLSTTGRSGAELAIAAPRFRISSESIGAGQNLSEQLRVGEEGKATLIPINRVLKIVPLKDGSSTVSVELLDGTEVRGPLRGGLYVRGLLRTGEADLDADLRIDRDMIDALEEIIFVKQGELSPTVESVIAWHWMPKGQEPSTEPVPQSTKKEPRSVQVDKPPSGAGANAPPPPEDANKRADAKLRLAKNILPKNPAIARAWLEEILRDYEGSEAAKEASKLLTELQ